MPYGPEDQHDPFARSGAYGNDMMTMTGPVARRRRRKGLRIGQRLADGSIYGGNMLLDSLRQTKESLEAQINALQEQLFEVEAQIQAAKKETHKNDPDPKVEIDASQAAVQLAVDNNVSLHDVITVLELDPDQKINKPHVEQYLEMADVNDRDSSELSKSGGSEV